MYGYNDYDGPNSELTAKIVSAKDESDEDASFDANPLQAGFWMDGDSLAPPCGTSISILRKLLQSLDINKNDVLYDLGCGDGRVCLEAWHIYQCRTVGIEVEQDLVDRAQYLVKAELKRQRDIPTFQSTGSTTECEPQIYKMDLRSALDLLVAGNNNIKLDRYRYTDNTDTGTTTTASIYLPEPTIVVLYLLPEALSEIASQLGNVLQNIINCRIVCNSWGIPSWEPIQVIELREEGEQSTKIFVYTRQSVPNIEP